MADVVAYQKRDLDRAGNEFIFRFSNVGEDYFVDREKGGGSFKMRMDIIEVMALRRCLDEILRATRVL